MKKTALKRALAALMTLSLALCLTACQNTDGGEKDKLSVACSIFPVYDFAREIAGTKADVYLLLPTGTDSHEYEPSVGDMVALDKTDLFIYTDGEMEIWADDLSKGFNHARPFRCAEGIDLEQLNEEWEEQEHEADADHDEHEAHSHHHRYDAHIWLDPTLAAVMCENIARYLSAADPQNAEYYSQNLTRLTDELTQLDAEFSALFARHPDAVLCFGGEFAYSHFLRHYGVSFISAYDSCGENEEVNLARLILMTKRMRDTGAAYIFTDEHSQGLIAKQISEETGAKIELFHTLHSVSRDEMNLSYIELMQRNYRAVARSLGEE